MRAKLVNEAIKHMKPRSEEELFQQYAKLSAAEKLLTGFENNDEELVKMAIEEEKQYVEIANLFLKNPITSVEMDTAVNLLKDGKIVRDQDTEYFLDFIKDHKLKYKIIDPHGPGGGMPIIEYTGRARNIIELLLGPFNPGLEGHDMVEELMFYLDIED